MAAATRWETLRKPPAFSLRTSPLIWDHFPDFLTTYNMFLFYVTYEP